MSLDIQAIATTLGRASPNAIKLRDEGMIYLHLKPVIW